MRQFRVEVTKGRFETIALPAHDLFGISRVARSLGVSVRTLRRMITDGSFPVSHIHHGKTAFWQRQFVRTWERERLRNDGIKKPKSRYAGLDVIDREEENDFSRKSISDQGSVRALDKMRSLLDVDRAEFARQHPNLKPWLKTKGLI